MRTYAIMREALRKAHSTLSYSSPRPKKIGEAVAGGQLEALGEFIHYRYIASWNRQYAGHRYEWRSERNLSSEWRPWNGTDDPGTRGREWSAVVTLANGRNRHEQRLFAWRSA